MPVCPSAVTARHGRLVQQPGRQSGSVLAVARSEPTASTQATAASLHDNMAMVMMLHDGDADGDDHGGDDEQAPIIWMTMVVMMLMMMLSDDNGGDVEHEYTDGDDN